MISSPIKSSFSLLCAEEQVCVALDNDTLKPVLPTRSNEREEEEGGVIGVDRSNLNVYFKLMSQNI